MTDIITELSIYFKSKGISQKDIALSADVKPQYINAIFKSRRQIGKSLAEKLESAFGISSYWLLTGRGPMLLEDENEKQPDLFMMDESNIEYDNLNEADISTGLKKRQLEALIIKFAAIYNCAGDSRDRRQPNRLRNGSLQNRDGLRIR